MIVREFITRLGFSLNQGQLNNAERGVQRVRNQAEQAAQSFRNMAASLAGIFSVRALATAADEMQNLRARIALLPQTVGDVGAAMDEVGAHATKSGQQVEAYTAFYTRLGNAGKDYIKGQEDLLNITDTVANALRVGGASTQEAASVMTQFSQALGAGTLQGEEFRAMAEAAPQFLDKLSEAMGIPREQLKKMGSEGKLTSKAVIEATRSMSGYFQEQANKMPMTIGMAMTKVGNRFKLGLDKMNRETGIVVSIANSIIKVFDKIELAAKSLIKSFGGIANMMRFVGIAIGAALGVKVLMMLNALRIAGFAAIAPYLAFAAAVVAITLVVEDLYNWIQGGDSLTGKWLGKWDDFKIKAEAVWESFMVGINNAIFVVGAFWEVFKALFNWLATVVIGVLLVITGHFQAGFEAIGQALMQVLGQWGQWILTAFQTAFDAATAYITSVFSFWATLIYNAIFTPIVNAVSNAWASIKGFAGSAFEGIKSFAGGAAQSNITPANTVTPGTLAQGANKPSVSSNTNVTVTVPPGTTAEQAKFLEGAAQKTFSKGTNDKLARDLAVYAP